MLSDECLRMLINRVRQYPNASAKSTIAYLIGAGFTKAEIHDAVNVWYVNNRTH